MTYIACYIHRLVWRCRLNVVTETSHQTCPRPMSSWWRTSNTSGLRINHTDCSVHESTRYTDQPQKIMSGVQAMMCVSSTTPLYGQLVYPVHPLPVDKQQQSMYVSLITIFPRDEHSPLKNWWKLILLLKGFRRYNPHMLGCRNYLIYLFTLKVCETFPHQK